MTSSNPADQQKTTTTTTTAPSTGVNEAGGGGLFNFQQMMEDYYAWQPAADDVAGIEQKRAFEANLI